MSDTKKELKACLENIQYGIGAAHLLLKKAHPEEVEEFEAFDESLSAAVDQFEEDFIEHFGGNEPVTFDLNSPLLQQEYAARTKAAEDGLVTFQIQVPVEDVVAAIKHELMKGLDLDDD